jgi:hypothetical protein
MANCRPTVVLPAPIKPTNTTGFGKMNDGRGANDFIKTVVSGLGLAFG